MKYFLVQTYYERIGMVFDFLLNKISLYFDDVLLRTTIEIKSDKICIVENKGLMGHLGI